MKYLLIFITFLFCTKTCAQESHLYNLVSIENKIIDKGEYIDDKKTSETEENRNEKLIYILNIKKDSITYYNFYNSELNIEEISTLYSLIKKENILLLNSKRENEENTLQIKFNSPEKSIVIGKNDIFYLNKDYFDFLYQTVFQEQNIPNLVDFLEDFLDDYNLDNLKFITSNEKYKHQNFKIQKAHLESYRSQASDYLDKWDVNFSYNKRGLLNYLKKESEEEGDIALEKKLILNKKGSFKYTIHKNNESRLITDVENTFDLSKKIYNEKMTAFQVGLGRESRSITQRISYKVIPFDNLFLNSKNILLLSK